MTSELDERERLLSRYGRRFDAGSIIYREGEAAAQAFLVQEGRVRLFKPVGAMERSLRVVRPGEVFGESALLSGSTRPATAIALDTVVTLAFDAGGFDQILVLAPEVGTRVAQQLVRRLRDAEDQIELLMIRDAQSKVVVALLKLAQNRAGTDARVPALEVTPLELSAQMGLDVDSVKRIVLGLRESGYVRIQDERIEIPDVEALRELHGLLGVKEQLRGGARDVRSRPSQRG
ncbi:MAG TPA: Crp/Fnr family transcriptional regulator [Polyangiaceae bacterium]|nr:Crp/Fnr family transcriptional regulator [Polyangiaceae bacterium]